MTAAWQASGTLLGSTGADLTPVNPAHATNDILILQTCSRDTTQTCLTPSGWTLLAGPTNTTAWRSYWFWKRATSASQTNPLCNWSAGTSDKYAIVHNIRGAITFGNPFAASAATAGSADPGVATGVTTTNVNQLVITLGLIADNTDTASTTTATNPSSFTTRNWQTISTGAYCASFITSATRATAGATGNVSHDFNTGADVWGILVAALRTSGTAYSQGAAGTLSFSGAILKYIAKKPVGALVFIGGLASLWLQRIIVLLLRSRITQRIEMNSYIVRTFSAASAIAGIALDSEITQSVAIASAITSRVEFDSFITEEI